MLLDYRADVNVPDIFNKVGFAETCELLRRCAVQHAGVTLTLIMAGHTVAFGRRGWPHRGGASAAEA
jgi:hypothetical protein